MAYKIKSKGKMGKFNFQKYYQNLFVKPIKVEKIAENQQTGETHALISTKTTPKKYGIVYTEEDIADYGTNKKEAERYFKKMHSKR